MPLVFAENQATESGLKYADETGVRYQYPKMYRRLIQTGEQFIYYRGRKHNTGRRPQVYFGHGVVGSIAPDANDADRLICEIVDYEPFGVPVPFKNDRSEYLEAEAARRGYFQRGVRRISEDEYFLILNAADVLERSGTPSYTLTGAACREKAIWRLARTTLATSKSSKGQKVLRTVKQKDLKIAERELRDFIATLIEAQNGLCALTGLPLRYDGDSTDEELLCSLDRIDSSGHYSPDNLQVVCRFANRWKASQSDREFRRLISLLRARA